MHTIQTKEDSGLLDNVFKIALLLVGPYRGSTEIVQSHYDNLDQCDTYVSCLEHYREGWQTSGWNIKQIYTTPIVDITQTNWYRYRDDEAGQSGFWQFWNLRSAVQQTPNQYDFYIKSRSDLRLHSKLQVDYSNMRKDTLYCSAHSFHKVNWNVDSWINDEFYIGSQQVMRVIADYVVEFYNSHTHEKNTPSASNEANLRSYLRMNHIEVALFSNFTYSKDHNGVGVPTGYTGQFQLENT
jgi:hypothetical protein